MIAMTAPCPDFAPHDLRRPVRAGATADMLAGGLRPSVPLSPVSPASLPVRFLAALRSHSQLCLGLLCLGMAPGPGLAEGTGSNAMDAIVVSAIIRARATLPDFFGRYAAAPSGTQRYLLRVAVPYGPGLTEDIWCTLIRRDGTAFFGTLAGEPTALDLPRGSAIAWTEDAISDWLYFGEDDLMYGAFTLHAVLPQLDPEAAASLRAQLAPLDGQPAALPAPPDTDIPPAKETN